MKLPLLKAALLLALGVPAVAWSAPQEPPGGSAWVRTPVPTDGPRGFKEFEIYCSSCHAQGPEARPGTEALRAKYKGQRPALLSERTDLTPEYVKAMVRNGVSIMPFFRKTEISDAALDSIAAYLTRNNKP